MALKKMQRQLMSLCSDA